MWFLSKEESERWVADRGYALPHARLAKEYVRVNLKPLTLETSTGFAKQVVESIGYFGEALLWVTQWGVWPSGENLHLYYRLRQSYGETRPLHAAPGHLAADFETADLVSFLQLGMLFGWDILLVGTYSSARAFVSHDGDLFWYSDSESDRENFARGLNDAGLSSLVSRGSDAGRETKG